MIQNNRVNQSQENWMQGMEQHLKAKPAAEEASKQIGVSKPGFMPDINKIPEMIKPACPGCFEIFEGPDPQAAIDEVRNASGSARVMSLMEFQGKLDKMTTHQLREGQDYLVKLMADPFNKDDQLLGALLTAVNNELNSRESFFPKPIKPLPQPVNPFPGRVLD